MKNEKLFRLAKDVLLPDFEAALQGVNRFLGRQHRHPWQVVPGQSFALKMPLRSEYLQALKEGIIVED